MNALTKSVQILNDESGNPAFAVIPYTHYKALTKHDDALVVPNEVVNLTIVKGYTPAKAWREFLNLTQTEVAERLGMSQSGFKQIEANKNIRRSTRIKISEAFGIDQAQLDF